MENAVNQEVKSSRDKVKSRLAKRFPDRKFDTEDVQDAQGVQDAYDDSVEELFGEYESREQEYTNHSKRLTDLFDKDNRIASLFMAWASGENIMGKLIEDFGDDFLNALETEEGKALFTEKHSKWLEKVAKSKEDDEIVESNFKKSINELLAFQSENNLSDEEAISVFSAVHKIGTDMVKGIYDKKSFALALNALNHDQDVLDARREGEITGRNERINTMLRSGEDMDNLPPSLSGNGAEAGQSAPRKQKRTRLDVFGIKK